MPYFLVSKFHDRKHYSVLYDATVLVKEGVRVIMHSDGTEIWPRPIFIVEIPEYVASLKLDTLIAIYNGTYKRPRTTIAEVNITLNIATVKLRKITNAHQTD